MAHVRNDLAELALRDLLDAHGRSEMVHEPMGAGQRYWQRCVTCHVVINDSHAAHQAEVALAWFQDGQVPSEFTGHRIIED